MNIGIIGTNFISDELVDGAAQSGGFVLHSVYSRRMATGREFGAKYGVTEVFDDLEQFLSDPELEAVYIASPNAFHCAQAVAAMNHGKHVLVEKPAAVNLRELSEMEEAAVRNGVVLMEAMRAAWLPGYHWIKERLPLIGPVRNVQLQFCQYSRRYDNYKAGEILNAFNPALSNAAVMDIGVYALHVFVMLFGKPESIQAASVFLPNKMEGTGSAILTYPEMVGTVTWSKITGSPAPSLILGENGTMTIDHLSQLKRVCMKLRDGRTEEYVYTGPKNNMYYELEEFKRLVAERKKQGSGPLSGSSQTTAITGLCIEVMDEIRRQSGIRFPADA